MAEERGITSGAGIGSAHQTKSVADRGVGALSGRACGLGEMVDARDLKSLGLSLCGFESRSPYHAAIARPERAFCLT